MVSVITSRSLDFYISSVSVLSLWTADVSQMMSCTTVIDDDTDGSQKDVIRAWREREQRDICQYIISILLKIRITKFDSMGRVE